MNLCDSVIFVVFCRDDILVCFVLVVCFYCGEFLCICWFLLYFDGWLCVLWVLLFSGFFVFGCFVALGIGLMFWRFAI